MGILSNVPGGKTTFAIFTGLGLSSAVNATTLDTKLDLNSIFPKGCVSISDTHIPEGPLSEGYHHKHAGGEICIDHLMFNASDHELVFRTDKLGGDSRTLGHEEEIKFSELTQDEFDRLILSSLGYMLNELDDDMQLPINGSPLGFGYFVLKNKDILSERINAFFEKYGDIIHEYVVVYDTIVENQDSLIRGMNQIEGESYDHKQRKDHEYFKLFRQNAPEIVSAEINKQSDTSTKTIGLFDTPELEQYLIERDSDYADKKEQEELNGLPILDRNSLARRILRNIAIDDKTKINEKILVQLRKGYKDITGK